MKVTLTINLNKQTALDRLLNSNYQKIQISYADFKEKNYEMRVQTIQNTESVFRFEVLIFAGLI